jgi:hypothetical protein
MSFKDAQLAIESRFAAAFSCCPIKYENVDFVKADGEAYCELNVIDVQTKRASVGVPALERNWGIIQARIFTPRNIGTATGRALADAAAGIFRDAQFDGITCLSPAVRNIGEVEGWWLTSMTTEFYRDETF